MKKTFLMILLPLLLVVGFAFLGCAEEVLNELIDEVGVDATRNTATRVEAESMTKSGQYTGSITSPFNGVVMYANNDKISYDQYMAWNSHTFSLRGASNNSNTAQVELKIAGTVYGIFKFTGTTVSTQNITVTHNKGGGASKIELTCINDNGTWDVYVDYFELIATDTSTGSTSSNNTSGSSSTSGSGTTSTTTSSGATRVEAESMTKAGTYTGSITSPFNGVVMYANNDKISYDQYMAWNSHTFSLRGASNNSNTAQVELRIGGTAYGIFKFTGTTVSTQNIKVTHNRGGGASKIELVCVNDNGTWDVYVDYFELIATDTSSGGSSSGSTTTATTAIKLNKTSLTLTVGAKEKLTVTFTGGSQTINWSSSNTSIATVASDGTITATGVTNNLNTAYRTSAGTGSATITAKTADGKLTATATVNTTTAGQVDIMSLTALKTQTSKYFMVGNIYNPSDATSSSSINTASLTRHFDILTHENDMKPYALTNARNASTGAITYTHTTAQRMVDAARASGLKVHGHTLLWHSQNPNWVWEQIASKSGSIPSGMNKANATSIMKKYITDVVTHYKGKIYSWDVLNEVFPDGVTQSQLNAQGWKNLMRGNSTISGGDANPWYKVIGSDFVYEGFLAARLADPNAILYYNDYGTDNPIKAQLIHDMVKEVNQRYASLSSSSKPSGEKAGRLLIEGIGMQEHHNIDITPDAIRKTLNLFKPLGVKISVAELDILAQSWSAFNSSGGNGVNAHTQSTATNQGLINQAKRYGEYVALYIEFSSIIERLSLWGVTDNASWISRGLPCLFDPNGKAKPAYYSFIKALGY